MAACLGAIVVMQVANVLLCRTERAPTFSARLRDNPLLLLGVAVELLLLALILYTPWGHRIFATAPLPVALHRRCALPSFRGLCLSGVERAPRAVRPGDCGEHGEPRGRQPRLLRTRGLHLVERRGRLRHQLGWGRSWSIARDEGLEATCPLEATMAPTSTRWPPAWDGRACAPEALPASQGSCRVRRGD
jgi:hypothetical protein